MPEVMEASRMAGDVDYVLRVAVADMAEYDAFYKRLIAIAPMKKLRKGFEAWFTALIELAWGKRRIMEIYVNVVEWGPGIYGAEVAARYYFRKSADALNPEEAVRLAAALPDPLGWSPRRPSRRLLARSAAIHANLPGVPSTLPLPCGRGA
jgi:hypothetical protein